MFTFYSSSSLYVFFLVRMLVLAVSLRCAVLAIDVHELLSARDSRGA